MKEQRSHRVLKVIYFDPDDPRVMVPRGDNLGWYLNFGHSRAVTVLAWLCGGYLLALVAIPIIAHPGWFVRDPTDIVWWGLSVLTALGAVRFNTCFAWSDYRRLTLASFGVLAGIGFQIQALLNSPLLLWWGNAPTWPQHLVLASIAAGAQTFGKWFSLVLLFRIRRPASAMEYFRSGLLVGLGFTIFEITLLYFRPAWLQLPMDYLGVWERASASLFHIYSAGLLALVLMTHRLWPLFLVFAIHTFSDFLATGRFGFSIYTLETTFSACAIATWIVFLLAVRNRQTEAISNRSNMG